MKHLWQNPISSGINKVLFILNQKKPLTIYIVVLKFILKSDIQLQNKSPLTSMFPAAPASSAVLSAGPLCCAPPPPLCPGYITVPEELWFSTKCTVCPHPASLSRQWLLHISNASPPHRSSSQPHAHPEKTGRRKDKIQ